MREKLSSKPARYGFSALAGVIIVVLVAARQGFALDQPPALNARYLSDGCFVAGLLLAGIGALMLIATTGFFDILSYGFQSLLVWVMPFRKPRDRVTFYDYKVAKELRRGKPSFFLLFTGLAYIVLSLVCLALYYRLPV